MSGILPCCMQIFAKVPAEVLDKFYGCGAPLPTGIEGLTVLDLGSGSGRDCYAAAALVGERGSVIGVDMTREQLEARDTAPCSARFPRTSVHRYYKSGPRTVPMGGSQTVACLCCRMRSACHEACASP